MKRKVNNEEHNYYSDYGGYARLVTALILGVLDRIRIPKKWDSVNIKQEMIDKKRASIKELKGWLNEDGGRIWFDVYSIFTGKDGNSARQQFLKICSKSNRHINKLEKEIQTSR